MKYKIIGIILAAGKGTRINAKEANKVSYLFLGKPIISYGVETFEKVCDKTIIVVGAFSESVTKILKKYKKVIIAHQKRQLGTAHAVIVALEQIKKNPPSLVLVGMGDHMMFYKPKTIKKLIDYHKNKKAVVSFITTNYEDPNALAWGRVERDRNGKVLDIIEHKDATKKQREIKELNSGFYCFDYKFLKSNIKKVKKSKVTNEYYLPDLVKLACVNKLNVFSMRVRFREIGIGINKSEELQESQKIYKKFN
jgi:bifunctional UDP-N-acetylglucosamine pyrophosphorylase/glucosamine-1-phosphate N-acetyltransferase